jgi:hypothetical protein
MAHGFSVCRVARGRAVESRNSAWLVSSDKARFWSCSRALPLLGAWSAVARTASILSRFGKLRMAPTTVHARLPAAAAVALIPEDSGPSKEVRMLPSPPLTDPDMAAESISDRITLAQCPRRRRR